MDFTCNHLKIFLKDEKKERGDGVCGCGCVGVCVWGEGVWVCTSAWEESPGGRA